jgi:hypothetical protein
MPALKPLSLTDSNGTAHNFDPTTNQNGLVSFIGVDGIGAPSLSKTLTVSLSRPSKTSKVAKSRIRFAAPVAVLDSYGIPTKVKSHDNWFDITFVSSEKATMMERDALVKMCQLILTDADLLDSIVNNRNFW